MWKFSFLFIVGAAISLKNAYAITDEEREAFHKYVMPLKIQCAKELEIDESTIEEAEKNKALDPCFVACFMERSGSLKDGLVDIDSIEQAIKEYVHDDDEIEQFTTIGQNCAMEANESDVSDGDKNCERAGIFISCLMDKKAAALVAH